MYIVMRLAPCTFQKCHSKASVCKNHFFRAQCICNYGYGGDGVKYCDGKNEDKPSIFHNKKYKN
jgi:hypothetical protein